MNKRIIFVLCCFFVAALQMARADEERNLLQHSADLARIKEALVLNQKWVPYPDYADRTGWDKLTGEFKEQLIDAGEKYLSFNWRIVKATQYLEYERSGNRVIMEDPLEENNRALGALVIAELAEGKGRFTEAIIDGVFHTCEMTSWALSAHLGSYQKTKRALPDHREDILELTQGDMSHMLAWTYYFLHNEFDKVDPIISLRLRSELQRRELDTYMQRDDFWWMAFQIAPGTTINNWNPWCNFNALTCFLLLENNPDVLAEAVYKSMRSVDLFLNHVKADGGCEEGPSYWGHAAGKLYDYLQMLSLGTGGKVSLFGNAQVKSMGEYIVRSYVGNSWVVNFADASARNSGNPSLIYRYGTAVDSPLMKGFAAALNKQKPVSAPTRWLDMFEGLETLRFFPQLKAEAAQYTAPAYTWYPETEFCYLTSKNGLFVASKGGYNNESHNHNDVGTFSLYQNTIPMIIDAGVGTYTRQTFSSERYSIWTMQSNYHNLPMINGVPQAFGSKYKATEVKANQKSQSFSLNIATAYPEEAKVEKWIRSYRLAGNSLKVQDNFTLTETKVPNQVNFLTWGKVDVSQPGVVNIEVQGQKLQLKYDKNQFDIRQETVKLTDPRLSNVWGAEIYRLSLTAKKLQATGTYTYVLTTVR